MQNTTTLAWLLATTAIVLVTTPPLASAQSKPQKLEEIVVTATRTATRAQKTPVALTVYTAKAIADAGVHTVQALQTIDASVNVTSSSGAAYVAVRGIASTDVTEIGDPAVPIARDGFFTNRSYSIASSLYDLDRIEVLKGPQGTLFGRNATGGLISITTKQPTNTLGGYAMVDVGNYGTVNSEGALNIPLSDKVQLRFSGTELRNDGYVKLTGVDRRGDDAGDASGRAQIAFQPFSGFRGLVSYQHDYFNDTGDISKDLPLGVVSPIGDPHSFPNTVPSSNKLNGNRVRWEFSYDQLPLGMTLTYEGGYDAEQWNHVLDATTPAFPVGYPATRQFIQSESPNTWNQEVRLATRQDQPLTAQIGFFHFSEDNTIASGLFNVQTDAPFAGTPMDFSNRYGIKFNYKVNTTSNGYFGQVGYKIIDTVHVTAGIRYTEDDKTRTGQAVLDLPVLVSPFIPTFIPPIVTPGDGKISENRPTFHAGIDWTPTAESMVYFKYDTGYKSGGFNSNGSAPSLPYGPETVSAFELGTKNRFFDNHVQLNLDVFYQDYKGYQASQTSSVLSGNGVFNVGSAKIKGIEAMGIAQIDNVGRFDANLTALETHFGRGIIVVDGASTPVAHDIGNNELPNAPSFVMTAGFQHDFALSNATITARIDGKFSSSYYYSVFNEDDTRSPAYATGNILLTYQRDRAPWQLQAYVRNFTDATVLAYAARNYVSDFNTYEFQPPLTFGARLRYKF